MDWFHGGLQFQVEHHLFPRLPRHNLRVARKMVNLTLLSITVSNRVYVLILSTLSPQIKELCKKHNLPYYEYGFIEANRLLLITLKKAAEVARKTESIKFSFKNSIIGDLLYARG